MMQQLRLSKKKRMAPRRQNSMVDANDTLD